MNRMKRDYCSKGQHPQWRAWKAKYDMTTIAWPWQGNFCTCCGAKVSGKGDGPPRDNPYIHPHWVLEAKGKIRLSTRDRTKLSVRRAVMSGHVPRQ